MQRWTPPVALSPQEKMLMKRLTRVRALFGFLRQHRRELFDDAFQEQLEGMRRCVRRRGRGVVAGGPSMADGPGLPWSGDSAILAGRTRGFP